MTGIEPNGSLRRGTFRESLSAAGLWGLIVLGLFLAWRGSGGDSQARPYGSPPQSDTAPGTLSYGQYGWGRRSPSVPSGGPMAGLGQGRNVSPPPRLTVNGKAAIRQGRAALEGGNLLAAAHAFERAAAADPVSPLAHDYLGIAYLRQRRFAAALNQFRDEIRLDPDPSTGWARIADVYYSQRNMKGAIRALEQAAALRPDRAQLHYNLGMLYPQALELNKAIESLGRYSALEPDNHYAHYLRGSLLYKLARLDEAERALNDAVRLAPTVGIYHFALAQVHYRRTASPETTERARAELQKALDNGAPEPAAVYYYLGLCYQRTGDAEAARRALQTSVQLAPDAWGAYYALAEALQKLGHSDDARKARARFAVLRAKEDLRMQRSFYEQEVERNPERADAHYQLAAFLMRQGDRQGAAKPLARASRLSEAKREDAGLRRRIKSLSAELGRSRGR